MAEELAELGGENIHQGYRVVYFSGSLATFYRAHLKLSTASRLYRILKDVPAKSPTIIFDKVKRIRWDQLFSASEAVKISITVAGQQGDVAGHLIGSKIREAITDTFVHQTGAAPNLSSRDANIQVTGFLHGSRLMVSLESSLTSLHKRGYRVEGHPAPLKETLAATLLRLCKYDGNIALLDPMCGSGSIVIEGAYKAMGKAPLIHRSKGEFGLEHWADFDNKLWRRVQEETRAEQHSPTVKLYARDISEEYLAIAKAASLKARVEKYIDFRCQDFFDSEKPEDRGLLLMNLPYGERLDDYPIDAAFLRRIGDHLKKHYAGWNCGLLLPESCPYKEVGLKPSARYDLLNGMIKVKFLTYSLY